MEEKKLTAWERMELIRHKGRPTVRDYIPMIFDEFYEMHGDRLFGDDAAIVGGIARVHGISVTVLGQVKGHNLEENKKTNFSSPHPEGYRKALRLAHQAEKFHRPVICFIDTPGAFCGIAAEERGQGEAIARCLLEFSRLKTPVISIVLGEGRLRRRAGARGLRHPRDAGKRRLQRHLPPGLRVDPLEGRLPGERGRRGDEDDGGRPLRAGGLRRHHPRGPRPGPI